MKHVLIGAAAAAVALLGAASMGLAQDPDGKAKAPPAAEKAPPAAEQEPGKDKRATQQPPKDQSPGQPKSTGAPQPGKDKKAAQQPKDQAQGQSKTSESPQPGKDKKAAQQKKEPAPGEPKATDTTPQSGKDRKSTQQQRKDQQGQSKTTDGPQPGKDKKSAQDSGKDQKQASRVNVTDQQRSSARERLRQTRVEKTRINVSINIGTRVPRSVRIHTLPVAIVEIAPAYRGYGYIVLEDDTICIVDPRTYVIVDVISTGSQRAERSRALSLSAEQMRLIYASVPKDRTADVRVRLALGAEVPRDVELMAFPADIVQRVPEIERYRFVLVSNDVVIVDPTDRAVALVINE